MRKRLTLIDASRELGLSYQATYRLLTSGRLRGERFGASWCIDGASVERVRAERARVPQGRHRREIDAQ